MQNAKLAYAPMAIACINIRFTDTTTKHVPNQEWHR